MGLAGPQEVFGDRAICATSQGLGSTVHICEAMGPKRQARPHLRTTRDPHEPCSLNDVGSTREHSGGTQTSRRRYFSHWIGWGTLGNAGEHRDPTLAETRNTEFLRTTIQTLEQLWGILENTEGIVESEEQIGH